MTWEALAGCREPGVEPNDFHPDSGPRGRRQAAGALHICMSHCPVRAECHAEAAADPPVIPQVLGGVRYTQQGARAATQQKGKVTEPSSVGCRQCRVES